MDARNMEHIPNDCFDLIIDKGITNEALTYTALNLPFLSSGLLYAQLCGQNNIKDVYQLLREMHRVCKPGGVYFIISHGPPDSRMGYLTRSLRWTVDHCVIGA
jgi:DNA modification methylase